MNWLLLVRKFPKFALAAGVFLASTGLFGFWWFFLRSRPHINIGKEDTTAQVEKIRSRKDWLFLAGGDLYDAGTGVVLFKNWLKGDAPSRLFWDAKTNKVIGQYEKGFVLYSLDGTKAASLFQKGGLIFPSTSKTAAYVKGKDIWQGDVDWSAFKFINEKTITTIGTFNELYFSENVLLGTGKILIVRNLNQLLRVNLENGEVKPVELRIANLKAGRSPDGATVVGDLPQRTGRAFFAYDVDTDEARLFPNGRNAAMGFTWLDNNRCAFIVGGNAIGLYDKAKNSVSEVMQLPIFCNQMGQASPSGRYVFCGSIKGGLLLDLETHKTEPLAAGSGITWIADDAYLFSRDVQDSTLRGIWLKVVGKDETRVMPEPFLTDRKGVGSVLVSKTPGFVLFETKSGFFTVKSDGTNLKELAKLKQPVSPLLLVEPWKD